MKANWLGFRGCLVLGILLIGTGSGRSAEANGDEEALRKRVQDLNRLTGEDAVNGQFRLLVDDNEGSKKLLAVAKTMARNKPESFSYFGAFILGQLAEEMKDAPASEAFFRICIAQAAKLQSTSKLSQAYLSLIDLHDRNNKHEACVKACKEFLELKARADKARLYLVLAPDDREPDGLGFAELDDYDPVRRQKPGVYRLMIQSIARQGKHEEALKLVGNLIKAQPSNWRNLQLKGMVLRDLGDYPQAIKVYEDVVARVAKDKELDQEDRDYVTERLRYTLSNIYIDQRNIEKATEHLQALLSKKPDDPTYNNDLGYIWADNNMKLEEAEKLIRKALAEDVKRRKKADPKLKDDAGNGAYLDSLGWVLYKQKKYTEAKDTMLKAVADKDAQHIEIFDHLGDVLWALNEKDKAIAAWKKGLGFVGTSKRDQQRKAAVEKKIQERK
jgi:tetratricopeptide (TPR) repeat protein